MKNKTIVITGGTDGIGAATALELCSQGANVIIIGRSLEKGAEISRKAKKEKLPGSINFVAADFSLLRNAKACAAGIAKKIQHLDVLIHAVGILITKKSYTSEGLEEDFAVSFLSRFIFTEELFQHKVFSTSTVMINIAASAPSVPSFAQMEFNNVKEVTARTGMKSHGQAQLANDLYTLSAARRYGIVTVGYGPGSVNTSIRREIPKIIRLIMRPFFYFTTREPIDVATQLSKIIAVDTLKNAQAYFFNKNGAFKPSDFIVNEQRQKDLIWLAEALSEKALKADISDKR